MIPERETPRRRVIPRWRKFADVARLGELGTNKPQVRDLPSSRALESTRAAWLEEQSVTSAGDYLMATIVAGKRNDALAPASLLLKAPATTSLRRLAESCITLPTPLQMLAIYNDGPVQEPALEEARRQKSRIRFEPRDAIAWVDLARAYASRGQDKPAKQAIEMALKQAPNNKFVLRSASRFFVHLHQFDRAHAVVVRSPATKYDPWLSATEIASATLADIRPRFIRDARSMLKSRDYAARDTAELASALATIELESGNRRSARKLFAESLIDPNENAVAQAQWAAKQQAIPPIDLRLILAPFTFEARSSYAFAEERWRDCAEAVLLWMQDEPFAIQPAALGSYIAVEMLEDLPLAETFARKGLQAHPGNTSLLNNLAVALAQQGRTSDAEGELNKIRVDSADQEDTVIFAATRGLICFRSGDRVGGRQHYERAISIARNLYENGNRRAARLAARAEMHWLYEEALAEPSTAPSLLGLARSAAATLDESPPAEVRLLIKRLESVCAGSINAQRVPAVTSGAGPLG